MGIPAYAALDLGTNNCRLLIAKPSQQGFRVIGAFSRIVRLGEGVSANGVLSEAAMARTMAALNVCARKIDRYRVRRMRLIATHACRAAGNANDFVRRVKRELGLDLEVVDRETEAQLAVSGCASLIDPPARSALIFDIGGGSLELALVRRNRAEAINPLNAQYRITAWTSLHIGVVTLAERHGGVEVTPDLFATMVADVTEQLRGFEQDHGIGRQLKEAPSHLLGTSGTVTTVAGVHLNLRQYRRAEVDGCWLTDHQVGQVTEKLMGMSYAERAASPCIGPMRADLVLAGLAILTAIRNLWPCAWLRVADRGLREGLLTIMMAEDGFVDGCASETFSQGPVADRAFH